MDKEESDRLRKSVSGRPWDPSSFDVDVYVKSDALYAIPGTPMEGGDKFVSLEDIDQLEGFKPGQAGANVATQIKNLITAADQQVKNAFPGWKDGKLSIRAWSQSKQLGETQTL